MALRKPLEAHLEHFSILLVKWLSEPHFDHFGALAESLHTRATESGVFDGVFENKFLESSFGSTCSRMWASIKI